MLCHIRQQLPAFQTDDLLQDIACFSLGSQKGRTKIRHDLLQGYWIIEVNGFKNARLWWKCGSYIILVSHDVPAAIFAAVCALCSETLLHDWMMEAISPQFHGMWHHMESRVRNWSIQLVDLASSTQRVLLVVEVKVRQQESRWSCVEHNRWCMRYNPEGQGLIFNICFILGGTDHKLIATHQKSGRHRLRKDITCFADTAWKKTYTSHFLLQVAIAILNSKMGQQKIHQKPTENTQLLMQNSLALLTFWTDSSANCSTFSRLHRVATAPSIRSRARLPLMVTSCNHWTRPRPPDTLPVLSWSWMSSWSDFSQLHIWFWDFVKATYAEKEWCKIQIEF